MNDWQVLAMALAMLLVIVLSIIAVYYRWRLYKLTKQRIESLAQDKAHWDKLRSDQLDSVRVIASALLQKQVGLAEASLRISRLFDALSLEVGIRQEYCAFDHMANKIEHIPILGEWSALPKKQKREYEKFIMALENDFSELIEDAARRLLSANLSV